MKISKEKESAIDAETAKKWFRYESETGKIFWKKGPYQKTHLDGKEAGRVGATGYRLIAFNRKTYLAHRLAWLIYYKEHCKLFIDHINGNKQDNRIENLRAVSREQNQINRKVHREGRLYGARKRGSGKYTSSICIDGKNHYLGTFNTELEAHNAYKKHFENRELLKLLKGNP
jgi:hypothetical protein